MTNPAITPAPETRTEPATSWRDRALAQTLEAGFAADLTQARAISLREWTHRPVTERAPELLGWIFERQQ